METQLQNKSIILIDDDAITNMINTKIIKMSFNFEVHDYVNAQQALDQLKHYTEISPEKLPDIIFLDINMPIMDGWEFLEVFQNFSEDVLSKCKVFILTSSIDLDDIKKSKKYRVVKNFVSKPLTTEKIRSLIES